jgi:hypothetical protein
MRLRARLERLTARVAPRGFDCKIVQIVPEDGPAVEGDMLTGLTLRVAQAFSDDPYSALTDKQRALIGPDDEVIVFCPHRIRLPGAPPRLIPRQHGRPQIALPNHDLRFGPRETPDR